jgi:hypothetical protein
MKVNCPLCLQYSPLALDAAIEEFVFLKYGWFAIIS